MSRKMRFAPDGPFAGDPAGGGPVVQGAGTPGVVFHGQVASPDQPLTGAAYEVEFELDPTDGADLPWLLQKGRFWEFVVDLLIEETVTTPGGNLVMAISGRDVVTSVRQAIASRTIAVPPSQTNWSIRQLITVDANGWANDRDTVRLALTGAATLTLVATNSALVATQYVP